MTGRHGRENGPGDDTGGDGGDGSDRSGRPRHEARFAGHDPAAGHDTSGLPWAGREMPAAAFAGDDGRAEPRLREALSVLAEAAPPARTDAEERLLSRLSEARLLVPIVAKPADDPGDPDAAELSAVVLTAPDGRRALPAFTGLGTLTEWSPSARPVPVRAADAARAAIEDGCEALLLDLGAAHAAVLRLSHVWALAQGRPWGPAHLDPVVRHAVAAAGRELPGVVSIEAADASDRAAGLTRVELALTPGLTSARVQDLARTVGDRLAADPEVRIRLDAVQLTVRVEPDRRAAGR